MLRGDKNIHGLDGLALCLPARRSKTENADACGAGPEPRSYRHRNRYWVDRHSKTSVED
jgi:hypothetical protein